MLTQSKKLLNAVKKLYTKVTGGKTTKSNDLPTVINSMAENYVGGGSSGTGAYVLDLSKDPNFLPYPNTYDIYIDNQYLNVPALIQAIEAGSPILIKVVTTDLELESDVVDWISCGEVSKLVTTGEYKFVIYSANNETYVIVHPYNAPDTVNFTLGESIGGTGNLAIPELTFEELLEKFNNEGQFFIDCPNYAIGMDVKNSIVNAYKSTGREGDTLYTFELAEDTRVGRIGFHWDDANQRFIIYNGIM